MSHKGRSCLNYTRFLIFLAAYGVLGTLYTPILHADRATRRIFQAGAKDIKYPKDKHTFQCVIQILIDHDRCAHWRTDGMVPRLAQRRVILVFWPILALPWNQIPIGLQPIFSAMAATTAGKSF